jgi:hypothetical protein
MFRKKCSGITEWLMEEHRQHLLHIMSYFVLHCHVSLIYKFMVLAKQHYIQTRCMIWNITRSIRQDIWHATSDNGTRNMTMWHELWQYNTTHIMLHELRQCDTRCDNETQIMTTQIMYTIYDNATRKMLVTVHGRAKLPFSFWLAYARELPGSNSQIT